MSVRGRNIGTLARGHPLLRVAALFALFYLFFVSIALMSEAFGTFGKGFAQGLLQATSNPLVSLLIGILSTALVQSSSTTTSMTVALVASNTIELQGAIPIIMGANIGTSVTNTLVSVAHISRSDEFKKAFAAATIHDFFNLIAVVVLFPLQLLTNFIGASAQLLAESFQNLGGLKFVNPLKVATAPAVDLIKDVSSKSGTIMLILALAFLFISLRYIVVNLRAVMIGRIEAFFSESLFKNATRAMVLGLAVTVLVQSSSVTTSLVVPLVAAGILTLHQIFPFTLGANIGTTLTAMLAALVTSDVAAVTAAFAHLVFNVSGIIIVWPIRRIPIYLAEALANWSVRFKFVPVLYIVVVFFVLPLTLIVVLR